MTAAASPALTDEQLDGLEELALTTGRHVGVGGKLLMSLISELRSERAEVKRLARGHDEYNRVNQILSDENDSLTNETNSQHVELKRLRSEIAKLRSENERVAGLIDEEIEGAIGELICASRVVRQRRCDSRSARRRRNN